MPTTASSKAPWALLLFFALAVRALIPAGWMPSGQNAVLSVKICTGMVGALDDLPGKLTIPLKQNEQKQTDPCPFSTLGSLAGDVPAGPPAIVAAMVSPLPIHPLPQLSLKQLRWLAHALARGPPPFA